MSWHAFIGLRGFVVAFGMLCIPSTLVAQHVIGSLTDTTNQADYLIITSPANSGVIQPFADYKASGGTMAVNIVLMDSVVRQFPAESADTSLRFFVNYISEHWRAPHPQFLLLAGNANAVPVHKVASDLFSSNGEDSVALDQWYVNSLDDSVQRFSPRMAIGRFPAWSASDLQAMVEKTIAYEEATPGSWASRAIAVADSEDWEVFENYADTVQHSVASVWKDTLTIFVRPGSPLHASKSEFLAAWNQGCALVQLLGHGNDTSFSDAQYLLASDVNSLSEGVGLPVCSFWSRQRFDNPDSLPLAVDLLQALRKGAVAVIAPTGLVFASQDQEFSRGLMAQLTARPDMSIGEAWVAIERQMGWFAENRRTIFGDPSLVMKSNTIASVGGSEGEPPTAFTLYQNYPNPFNPTTAISFDLPVASIVRLVVYDVLGREVAVITQGQYSAGRHSFTFDGARLSSGVYFYRLQAGSFMQTRSFVLEK